MPILQIASIVIAFLIGILVVTRNPSDRNRWFLLFFNASLCVWIFSYMLADAQTGNELFWNRMVFAGSLLIVFAGYLLVASMGNKLGTKVIASGVALATWIGTILTTPIIVSGVQARLADGNVFLGFDVERGWAYPLYVGSLLLTSLSVVAFVLYLRSKSRGRFRSQLGIIVTGFATMLIIGVITGIVLPLLTQNSSPANFTFLSVFAVMVAFTYSIVQQRLFDIRAAIARSLGYFLSLTAITIFYAIGVFLLSDLVFVNQSDVGLKAYYIVAAIFVALTFGPLTKFFSRATSRIFFRDTYDTEDVLGKLTNSLVGTVDIKNLTHMATRILKDAVKVQSLEIIAGRDGGKYSELFASIKTPQQLMVTDEVTMHKRTAEKLNEANIALIARLQTHQEVVGYIVCGPKIRGDALTSQDIELMRVASGELAVAVQNALRFEEISHFNVTLKQEVEEATAQLRDSNRKLKKLDEAKDEFISMASHQLRTPLTSVKGYISMVMDGDAGKLTGPQQKLLEEAFIASQRMVYLIGDFLNVSRLQTGRFVLEAKRTDLARVVNDEVLQLASTAARRNITVKYHHPVQFPIVAVDENKMRQVIMNFIDNAIFYSRVDSTVDVMLVNTGREIKFEVHDTGIGVPVADRHKLFTKFFRAPNARKARPDGTGIGLFMAKKVVTAHGGTIIFESKENKGSTFGFILPLDALKHQAYQLRHKEGYNK